ncbi:hypothetical protein CAPTEDRAFT_86011, partial [Capitella teleta]
NGRSQGIFTSPNYPQIYPSNINCILYTFIGELEEIVELTFLEFDLQVPITNNPDFIVVRDGLDVSSSVIAQYCNTLNGEQVISSGKDLHVNMMVDSKNQRQGFAATFEFIR